MTRLRFNAACPICSAPVVAFPTTMKGASLGPMMAPRTQEELVAACAIHGRPPYNDRTLVATGEKDSLLVPTTPGERRAGFAILGIYALVFLLALTAILLSQL